MQSIKYLACILFLSLNTQVFSQDLSNLEKMGETNNTISPFLDLFPLHIGNIWQYKITVDSGFNNDDTTYYANREVLKDTLVQNGFVYKKIFDTRFNVYNPFRYFRIDSSTGCTFEYFAYENEEFLIDSLKMMAGDTIFNGYGHLLECTQVDTINLFGENRQRKHFSLHLIPIYYRNKYAEGIGEVFRYDYYEHITAVEVISEITYAKINGVEFGQLVSVPNIENKNFTVLNFILYQNYPNPFNPITKIKFTIPQSPLLGGDGRGGLVTLKVFDVLGNQIATLVNEEKPPGTYEVEFSAIGGSASGGDAGKLPSGIYFYQLKVYPTNGAAEEYVDTKKMLLLK